MAINGLSINISYRSFSNTEINFWQILQPPECLVYDWRMIPSSPSKIPRISTIWVTSKGLVIGKSHPCSHKKKRLQKETRLWRDIVLPLGQHSMIYIYPLYINIYTDTNISIYLIGISTSRRCLNIESSHKRRLQKEARP